jgi:hypothetical protein
MSEMMNAMGLEEVVRARAYAMWESEGRPSGRDAEHWRLSEEEALRELDVRMIEVPDVKPVANAARKKSGAKARAAASSKAR